VSGGGLKYHIILYYIILFYIISKAMTKKATKLKQESSKEGVPKKLSVKLNINKGYKKRIRIEKQVLCKKCFGEYSRSNGSRHKCSDLSSDRVRTCTDILLQQDIDIKDFYTRIDLLTIENEKYKEKYGEL
jgi:hypothetical protein